MWCWGALWWWRAWAAAQVVPLATVAATEVLPYRHGGWLGVEVRAPTLLDERVASTVESGLPGTCAYRCTVERRSDGIVARRSLELQIRLDLWENHYVLEGPGRREVFASLAAADSAWSHVRGLLLVPLDRLQFDEEYRVRVEAAVLPLGLEDRRRISHFVTESGRGDREFSLDVGAVLHRLFGRSRAEPDTPLAVSDFFRPAQLREREEQP